MARVRQSVESVLMGHFATVELAVGYRHVAMGQAILRARALQNSGNAEPEPLKRKGRKPRVMREGVPKSPHVSPPMA